MNAPKQAEKKATTGYGDMAPVLLTKGYMPIPIKLGEKRPEPEINKVIGKGWSRVTADDVPALADAFGKSYVGLVTGAVRAFDVDFMDELIVKKVITKLTEDYPGVLVRRGNPPKVLFVFRAEKAELGKRASKWYYPPGIDLTDKDAVKAAKDKRSRLEVLGKGQQFVAKAYHPDTREPYVWKGGRSPVQVPVNKLPVITESYLDEIFEWIDNLATEAKMVPAGSEVDAGEVKPFEGKGEPFIVDGYDLQRTLDVIDICIKYGALDMETRGESSEHPGWLHAGMVLHMQGQGESEWLDAWKSISWPDAPCQTVWKSFRVGGGGFGLKNLLDALHKAPSVPMATLVEHPRVHAHRAVAKPEDFPEEEVREVEGEVVAPEQLSAKDVMLADTVLVTDTGEFVRLKDMSSMKTQTLNMVWGHVLSEPQAATVFKTSPNKMIVAGLRWWPGETLMFEVEGKKLLNSYMPSDIMQEARSMEQVSDEDIEIYLELVQRLIPGDEQRGFLLDLFAFTAQRMDVKSNVHPLLGGAHGIGKDSILQPLINCIGEDHAKAIDEGTAASDYDDHLVESKIVVVEEVQQFIGKLDFENKMKMRLASPPAKLQVNPKSKPKQHIPNIHLWMFYTNYRTPMNISQGDRRLFCVWCEGTEAEAQQLEAEGYYKRYWDWLEYHGGFQKVAGWLMQRDVSKFDPKKRAMMTPWKQEIIDHSGTPVQQALRRLDENPNSIFHRRRLITAEELIEELGDVNGRKPTYQHVSQYLTERGAVQYGQCQKRIGGQKQRARVWILDDLERLSKLTGADLYQEWHDEVAAETAQRGFPDVDEDDTSWI